MAITLHKNAPFNELHNAKLRTGTRPASPEGVGDAHWNPSTNTLSLADSAGTAWEEFILASGSSALAGASVYSTSSTMTMFTHPTAPTDFTWNAEHFDGGAFHDNAVNPERFTIPTTGVYLVGWVFRNFNGSGAATYRLQLRKNGTNIYANNLAYEFSLSSGIGFVIEGHDLLSLVAGDYITIAGSTSSTSSGMGAFAGLITGSRFWIQRVS